MSSSAAGESDAGPLPPRRAGVRRREERPDQGLRQPRRTPTPTVVRRPADAGPQLLGPRPARARPRPELREQRLRLRPLRLRRGDRRHRAALGNAGATSDGCPTPPGATDDGCVVSGRLSRFTHPAASTGTEQVLIEDWCQQYPSHSIGTLAFGADGELYVSGGDGASFNFADYGPGRRAAIRIRAATRRPASAAARRRRRPRAARCAARTCATPADPTGARRRDPAGRPGDRPGAAGQPVRRQLRRERAPDRRLRPAQPVPLHHPAGHRTSSGSATSAGTPGRRSTALPIPDRRVRTSAGPATRATAAQPGYEAAEPDDLQARSTPPADRDPPYYTYNHTAPVVHGETLPDRRLVDQRHGVLQRRQTTRPTTTARCSSPITPATASGSCSRTPTGNPIPRTASPAKSAPRARWTSRRARTATSSTSTSTAEPCGVTRTWRRPRSATASPDSGSPPLTVQFDGTGSSPAPRRHDHLRVGPRRRRPVRRLDRSRAAVRLLRRRDLHRAAQSHRQSRPLDLQQSPGHRRRHARPTASITQPSSSLTWRVGDTISFKGHANDPQQGSLPPSALSWEVLIHHCPSNCHTHVYQTFDGVDQGSFPRRITSTPPISRSI